MKFLKFVTATMLVLLLCGFSSAKNKPIQTKVTAKIEIPVWYHEGLYFDGKDIWVNNGLKGKTWVVDTNTGKVIREMPTPGTFTEAITCREKGHYIVTDWDIKKIYTARIEGNIMSVENEVSVAPAHPTGAVWNGKNLFVITWTRSLAGTRFSLLKMGNAFEILNTSEIKDIQEPSQIAWDGKNLWISSWYERRIYKVDPDTLYVTGYLDSPVKKTTGVTWDGSHLWVTGTYSDLYKIELQNN